MRVASCVVAGICLSLLAGCVTAQQHKVILSQRQSAFEGPLDGRWRKAHETRPVAILLGRAETTKILGWRRAALEAGCTRGKPRIRLAYDVGLGSGPIKVAYHFNDATVDQTGIVSVRGQRRNIVVIDYQPTALGFLAELGAATKLSIRTSRSFLEFHDALFRWDPDDLVLKAVLAACQAPTPPKEPAADDTDEPLDDAIKDVLPET